MCNAIAHRGPDPEGFHLDGPVGLGHRRLAIRDLSPAGQQPMFSVDKNVAMVFNGGIYKDADIKNDLTNRHGISFKTTCDREMICPAYQAYHMEMLKDFEGMFTMALFDKRENALFLMRDPIGIKPLYYLKTDNLFSFGSELKALLAHEDCPRSTLSQI